MPPGKLPAGPRSDSSPYHPIPLVSIARLLRMVSPLGGPAGAQPAASRRAAGLKAACAAAALAASEVAAERRTVILLTKQMVGEWPHLGGSGDGSVSS